MVYNVKFRQIGKDGNRTIFEMSCFMPTIITTVVWIDSIRIPNSIFEVVEKEIRFRFPNDNSVWFSKHGRHDDAWHVLLYINDPAELAQFLLWTSDGLKIECNL